MISEKAFDQALDLTSILDRKTIGIKPVEGSPLSVLVSASYGVTNEAVPVTDSYDTRMFSPSSGEAHTDNETHNQAFDETITFLSNVVSNHVSNAKNIVAPAVMQLADKIISRCSVELTDIETYKIIPVGLPLPMQNEGFKDRVIKDAGGIYANPEVYLKIKSELAPQAILELMLTGSDEYDVKIKEWFTSLGDSFFVTVWNSVFCDPACLTDKGMIHGLTSLLDNKETGVDAALAVYLISRKLFDEVPENTGLTLVEYKKIVNEYKDASSLVLADAYEKDKLDSTSAILVKSHNDKTKEVKVNANTYLDYIKNGGRNEIILGAIVSGVIPYSLSKLESGQEQFVDAWNRHNLISKSTAKNKAFIRFKEICLSSFMADLSTVSSLEQEFIDSHPDHVLKCKELAEQIVVDMLMEDMEKPYNVALKLVCRARFYYTDAEKILKSINDISEQNKDIDVREAALIATTEYLIDYITDQMKLC